MVLLHCHPQACPDTNGGGRSLVVEREARAANVPLGRDKMSAFSTVEPLAFRPPLPRHRNAAVVFREMRGSKYGSKSGKRVWGR